MTDAIVALTQFPNIIGKKSKKTVLLAKHRIRCHGHLHEIGLASNGQLWIPGHTAKELNQFIKMADLGNNPCKCAVILDAWRNGDITNDQIPEVLKRERFQNVRLSRRILKHNNKNNNWPEIDVIFGELLESVDKSSTQETLSHLTNFVGQTIYNTLLHRGYSKNHITINEPIKPYYWCSRIISLARLHNNDLINVRQKSGDWVNIEFNRAIIPNMPIYPNKLDEIQWRLIMDNAELTIIRAILTSTQSQNFNKARDEYSNIAIERINSIAKELDRLPKNMQITHNPLTGCSSVSIEHKDLTIHAVERLIKHYKYTEDKVKRLINHSNKRIPVRCRFPGQPGRGVSPLKNDGKGLD